MVVVVVTYGSLSAGCPGVFACACVCWSSVRSAAPLCRMQLFHGRRLRINGLLHILLLLGTAAGGLSLTLARRGRSGLAAPRHAAHSSGKELSNKECKVMCQRFGMSSMGEEFKGIRHPNDCVRKCDEVYPASEPRVRPQDGSVAPCDAAAKDKKSPKHMPFVIQNRPSSQKLGKGGAVDGAPFLAARRDSKDIFCFKETGGTCRHFACKPELGNTTCSDDHRCVCKGDECVDGLGRCITNQTALRLAPTFTIGAALDNGLKVYSRWPKVGGVAADRDIDDSSRWRLIKNTDGSVLIQNVEWESEFLALARSCVDTEPVKAGDPTSTEMWSPRDASWHLFRAKGNESQILLKSVYWDQFAEIRTTFFGLRNTLGSFEGPTQNGLWDFDPPVPEELIQGDIGLITSRPDPS